MSYGDAMEINSDDMVRPPITTRLDPQLLDRLDRWIAKQSVKVSRTAVIEAALTKWLDEQEVDDDHHPTKRTRHLTPEEQRATQRALRRSVKRK